MGFFGKQLSQYYSVNNVVVTSGEFGPATYLVDNAVEWSNAALRIDLTDTQIRVTFLDTGVFHFTHGGPTFEDADGTLERIVGVTIDPSTIMPGLDESRVHFDGDRVWIDWGNLSLDPHYAIVLNVAFAPPPPIVDHLEFTPDNDGTLTSPVDFNYLADNAYKPTGAIYNASGGDDVVILPGLATVDAGNPWSYARKFDAGAGNDIVQGANGNDNVHGSGGNDWLWGRAGNDDLEGGTGNDVLNGGLGADIMNGGSGADVFMFLKTELGTTRSGTHDKIGDFHPGIDKLDLSELFSDAPTFGGIHKGALSNTTSDAYAIGFVYENGRTWVEGDVNGDGRADFTIELANRQSLSAGDVIVNHPQWDAFMGSAAPFTFEQAHHDAILPIA